MSVSGALLEQMRREVDAAQRVYVHIATHPLFRERLAAEGRSGLYVCKADFDGLQQIHLRFGVVYSDKRERYIFNSLEKCKQLADGDPAVLTSRATRDENADPPRYGGGIRCMSSLRSASGYWEELDELFAVLWAFEVSELSLIEATAILEGNETAKAYFASGSSLFQ